MSARRESLLAADLILLFQQYLPEGVLVDLDSGEFTEAGNKIFHEVYTEIVAFSLDIELK